VIEKDDRSGTRWVCGLEQRRADYHIGPARLIDDRRTERVMPLTEDLKFIRNAPVAEIGPAPDDDPCRLAARMSVYDRNTLHARTAEGCEYCLGALAGREVEVTGISTKAARFGTVGRLAMPSWMTLRICLRSAPASGSRGARTHSEPKPHSWTASLM